jgi:hypothetical protein
MQAYGHGFLDSIVSVATIESAQPQPFPVNIAFMA